MTNFNSLQYINNKLNSNIIIIIESTMMRLHHYINSPPSQSDNVTPDYMITSLLLLFSVLILSILSIYFSLYW